MEDLFGTSLVVLVGGVIFALIVITFLLKMYRRASKEIAFVRTGVGGEKVVMNGGALVLLARRLLTRRALDAHH